MTQTDGLLVIDKPAGFTSHDVVARCRRLFGQRRVGHAGTLDPDATGVLLVGLGQATRLMQFLSGLPKRYRGEVVLGTTTATLDASGEVTGTWDMRHVTLAQAQAAAARLTGRILQVPPMVSALKVGGRRLHELAREGVEVERQPRPVTISSFVIYPPEEAPGPGTQGPVFPFEVECSSGTYVRSLAADLGGLLGGGAHLQKLRRLSIGAFDVEEAVTLEALEAHPVAKGPLEALRGMEQVPVHADLAEAVRCGRVLAQDVLIVNGANGPGPWAVVSAEKNELLAVYVAHRPGQVKPIVVFNQGD